MFLLPPTYVELRVSVGITTLLAIVVLQMTLNQDVPEIGYLMLMDKIYLCAYAFVVSGLTLVVWTTRLVKQEKESVAIPMVLSGAVVAFGAFLMFVGRVK